MAELDPEESPGELAEAGLRSDLHPTKRTGTESPQCNLTSAIHFVTTFSSVSGASIANAMRMTCDFA